MGALLHSHLWIALAAAALGWQTQCLLVGRAAFSPVVVLLFGGTLLVYGLHRLYGFRQAGPDAPRLAAVRPHRGLLMATTVLGGGLCAVAAWVVHPGVFPLLWPAALLALGYALPLPGLGRRLRDVSYLKIFLVAPVWAWLTVVLPAREAAMHVNLPMFAMFVERTGFVFALALAFDIRDGAFDRQAGVRTLPLRLGTRWTRLLTVAVLALALAAAAFNWHCDAYTDFVFGVLAFTFLLAYCAVHWAQPTRPWWYYAGLVDGLMVCQAALICAAVMS